VARNDEGVFFGVNNPGNLPLNIVLTRNSFVDNKVQFSGCFCEANNTEEPVHTWDDGEKGNYWSDYNGTDADEDGIGDTPYVIDSLNRDRYPLMQVLAVPATHASSAIPVELIVSVGVLLAIVAAAVAAYSKRRQKSQYSKTNKD